LYAHHVFFGEHAADHSSVAAIVGTGLGGGVIEAGRVIRGAAGMAGELGHVHIPMQGLLADGQPVPGAKVNVIAALDGGFNNYQLAVTDARGVYNAWFKAPAAIRTVTVDVPSLCSTGNDLDCSDSYSWLGSEGAVITAPRGMTLTAQTPNSWLGAEGAVITGTDSF